MNDETIGILIVLAPFLVRHFALMFAYSDLESENKDMKEKMRRDDKIIEMLKDCLQAKQSEEYTQ